MKYVQIAAYQLMLMLLISFFAPLTHATPVPSFNHIVFFGDSLSDNGNLYSVSFGFIPKSPPYYFGHFSNGKVWSEVVTEHYQQYGVTSDNYAVGGETAVLHNPLGGYLPFTVGASIDDYLIRSRNQDRSKDLFFIWIGANDYLPGSTTLDELTTHVVNNTQAAIEKLIAHGAKRIIVMNLPDMGRSPYAIEKKVNFSLSLATAVHNSKLSTMVRTLQNSYKTVDITLFDINSLLNKLIAANTFKDTTTSCWPGGFMSQAQRDAETASSLQNDFDLYMHTHPTELSHTQLSHSDLNALPSFIEHTPALMESYRIGALAAQGVVPCSNPDEHLFWDHIHPTTFVHQLLAIDAIAFIDTHESIIKP